MKAKKLKKKYTKKKNKQIKKIVNSCIIFVTFPLSYLTTMSLLLRVIWSFQRVSLKSSSVLWVKFVMNHEILTTSQISFALMDILVKVTVFRVLIIMLGFAKTVTRISSMM